jgi:hypothetical protein
VCESQHWPGLHLGLGSASNLPHDPGQVASICGLHLPVSGMGVAVTLLMYATFSQGETWPQVGSSCQ